MTPFASQGPMLYSTPQKVVSQVPKRRSGSTPSIGLPSSYPASPNMIAFEKNKASEDSSMTRNRLSSEDSLSIYSSAAMVMDHDSMASFETNPLHSESSHSSTTPSKSSRHRRQRNRALSDVDFAAIMNDFSPYVI